MIKLKPITNKSWLILTANESEKIGILSEQQGKFILISSSVKTTFQSRAEITNFFKEDIFTGLSQTKKIDTDKEYFINGYAVDFAEPIETPIPDSILPTFKKTKNSNVLYVAGYYCIHFPAGCLSAFCPKLSTLQSYNYNGPYRSKQESILKMKEINKNVRM